MATRFDDWEGQFLQHHGVKGQKWGVRRYQNEDGTLTEAGRKRVAQSGSYMEIDRKYAAKRFGGINSSNKQRVYEEFEKAYWKNHDAMYEGTHRLSKEYKKLHDSLKNKYASATLKDLGFKDNAAARRQVRAILKEISGDWNNPDPSWSDIQKAGKRRIEMMHPKRTKVKKSAKKVADAVGTIRKITG